MVKVINDAIRKEIEDAQKKQEEFSIKQAENLKIQLDAQNRMIKEVLEELRSVRMDLAEIKKKQKEDSEMVLRVSCQIHLNHTLQLETINEKNNQIEESLINPTIGELCGAWQTSYKGGPFSFLDARQVLSVNGNTFYWSHSRKKKYICIADVKIGSNRCKVKEDGTVEIETNRGDKYEMEMEGSSLIIRHGSSCTRYWKC